MQYIHTDGVYHPDEATIDGTVVCIEAGEIVGVHDRVPDDAEALYEGKGYAPRGSLMPTHTARFAPVRGPAGADVRRSVGPSDSCRQQPSSGPPIGNHYGPTARL